MQNSNLHFLVSYKLKMKVSVQTYVLVIIGVINFAHISSNHWVFIFLAAAVCCKQLSITQVKTLLRK